MSGGKMSGRQKMINMMYLVLIALLALNVSKEILRAFFLMEVSFESSKKNLDEKNNAIMKTFESNMKDQAAKTQKWYDKAKIVRGYSKEFCDYINITRAKLEELNGGDHARKELEQGQAKGTLTELTAPDQMEKHANYFVNEGHGKEVQAKVNETRAKFITMLRTDPDIQKLSEFKNKWAEYEKATQLRAEDEHGQEGGKHSWISMTLEHSPLAGVMTMLDKLQTDCKNLESDVLNVLLSQINAQDFKFDALVAKVIPTKGTMVTVGDQYEAEILLSAYNSKENHKMSVNGATIEVKDGIGIYKQTSSEGLKKIKGEILVLQPDGSQKPYPFEMEYMGFKSSAIIAAEKMNVLYIGLDNPLKISVPGFPPENVIPSASAGCALTGSRGNYIATITPGNKEIIIKASVKTDKGSKPMGEVRFRVKNVPKPLAQFGTITTAMAKAVQVANTGLIVCGLGPEFAFEGLNYTITKYSLVYSPKKGDAKFFTGIAGNQVRSDIKAVLGGVRKGDLISIFGLEAQGPAKVGIVKGLPSIVLAIE